MATASDNPGDDFILEQELDEQESICGECGNLHSCSTTCWYDDEDCMDCGQCDSCIARTKAHFEEMENEPDNH